MFKIKSRIFIAIYFKAGSIGGMDIKKDITEVSAAIRRIIPDATDDEMHAMAWIKFCVDANRCDGLSRGLEAKYAAEVIGFLRRSGCSR